MVAAIASMAGLRCTEASARASAAVNEVSLHSSNPQQPQLAAMAEEDAAASRLSAVDGMQGLGVMPPL